MALCSLIFYAIKFESVVINGNKCLPNEYIEEVIALADVASFETGFDSLEITIATVVAGGHGEVKDKTNDGESLVLIVLWF